MTKRKIEFNVQEAIAAAWAYLWTNNLALRNNSALAHRYNETFYLTASDLEGQVRRFAVEALEGKPRGSTGRAYGSGEGGDRRIRFRGNLLGKCRDWLNKEIGAGRIAIYTLGQYGSITKARYRPVGEPIGPSNEDKTLVHFRVNGVAGCVKAGPNPRKRPTTVCTGIFGNVTCPKCRNLKEFKAVAA